MDVQENARTQVLYRDVNDIIREITLRFGDQSEFEILCECGQL